VRQPTASLAIFFAAGMALASCSSGTGSGSPSVDTDPAPPAPSAPATLPEAPATTAPVTPAAPRTTAAAPLETAEPIPAQGLDARPDTMYCPGGSHEGCHTKADMGNFVDHMLALIAPMYDEVYGVSNRPANFYFVGTGQAGGSVPCTDSKGTSLVTTEEDYYYCPADKSIYTGQEQLWKYYYDIGDAAPFVAYAHEWGHHIQTLSGVHKNLPNNATPEQIRLHSINLENQADCFAGVWLYYADNKGWLEYPDDVGDIDRTLQEIASSDANPNRDHGTLQERTDSLLYGYNQGLRGCNAFFPNTPIYQG
jgi:hypothetical protein